MKIHTRTLIILGISVCILVFAISLLSQFFILSTYAQLEQTEAAVNVERVTSQIDFELEKLGQSSRDWAVWDDTYTFMEDKNSGYSRSILDPETSYESLQINGVLYYDLNGKYFDGRWYNLQNQTMDEVPRSLREYFTVHPGVLMKSWTGDGIRGFILLPEGPCMVSLHPVLMSSGEGPARGTLIMVSNFNDARVTALQDRARIPVKITRLNGDLLRTDPIVLQLTAPGEPEIVSSPQDSSTLSSYSLIYDIDGQPILLLQLTTMRTLYGQAMTTVLFLLAALLVIAIIFVIITEVLLNRYIVNPLTGLDSAMKAIGQTRDLSERLSISGDYEIASLQRSLNAMLQDLQENQTRLAEQKERLAQQKEQLSEANRKANLYLDIYLDVLTYEITNAMFAMAGYADLVKKNAGEKESGYAQRMIDTINKSRGVIRNIETISMIYKHPPTKNPIKLGDIIAREIKKTPGVNIRCEDCAVMVLADEMLGVVFSNLISNSIRFGGAAVEIVVSASDQHDGTVLVSVTDTGPGIPYTMKPTIFDRFLLGSDKRSSYGLGLNIVKMLIEAYGGSIRAGDRVTGHPDQGAAIRFTLKKA